METVFPRIVLVLFLLCLSAFFSGSETTLFSLSRAKLLAFKRSANPFHRALVQLLSKPREILSTILLGNEFVNTLIAIVVASLVHERLEHWGTEVATLVSVVIGTAIILVFGEIFPKSVALRFAPTLAPLISAPLNFFYYIAGPARNFLTRIADTLVHRFGATEGGTDRLIVEEEFAELLKLGRRAGGVEPEEHDLIHKVFEFGDKVVGQVMTPMNLVFALPVDLPFAELLREIKATRFSRVPIYERSPENIIGVLYVRDLFGLYRRLQKDSGLSIREILRPALFIEEDTRLEALLGEFRRTKIHFAVVHEEKKTLGIITMQDLLGELFGELEAA